MGRLWNTLSIYLSSRRNMKFYEERTRVVRFFHPFIYLPLHFCVGFTSSRYFVLLLFSCLSFPLHSISVWAIDSPYTSKSSCWNLQCVDAERNGPIIVSILCLFLQYNSLFFTFYSFLCLQIFISIYLIEWPPNLPPPEEDNKSGARDDDECLDEERAMIKGEVKVDWPTPHPLFRLPKGDWMSALRIPRYQLVTATATTTPTRSHGHIFACVFHEEKKREPGRKKWKKNTKKYRKSPKVKKTATILWRIVARVVEKRCTHVLGCLGIQLFKSTRVPRHELIIFNIIPFLVFTSW